MYRCSYPRIVLIVVSLIACSGIAEAQLFFSNRNPNLIPVFRSKADSIQLYAVEKGLIEAFNHLPLNEELIDSLQVLHQSISEKGILRFRKIYRPGKDYISVDSLLKVADLSTIKQVSVSNLHTIPVQVLKCANLESLELINTTLKQLPEELNLLPKLTTVTIYNNHPTGVFRLSRNDHVNSLTIRNENPKLLPVSYKKLSALRKLDLSENRITKFPNGARHNKKLEELILQRNAIRLKKGKLKSHPYVEKLALQNNEIEYVPASISKFKNLKKLNFNNNKITRVHRSIRLLKKLEQLSFYNNKLNAVPSGVYGIESLQEIDLFHNQIEKLEPEFIHWKNLHTLYLSHNQLLELPENINELALEGIYLWDNRLSKLPESLGTISTLKYLRVNHNFLKTLPASILNLTDLEELDVSHNYITEIQEELFNYKNLKILALVNNPWNQQTKQFLKRKTDELKARGVFVLVSDDLEVSH